MKEAKNLTLTGQYNTRPHTRSDKELQNFFNTFMFDQERAVYESEGIDYGKVGFVDNQPVLDLLERKGKANRTKHETNARYGW